MNKADRIRIKFAVLRALDNCGMQLSLPVPIKQIVHSFPNIRLISYKTQMTRRGISYKEMLNFAGTVDACTDYDAATGHYIIYYNDMDPSKVSSNRYRWNIAHELGHILLNHHKNYLDSRIFRNKLSNTVYRKLEEEADMFAAYILVPHIVISCVSDKNHMDIKHLCKISGSASATRSACIMQWASKGIPEQYDFSLLEFYSEYVETTACGENARKWLDAHRICSRCGSKIPKVIPNFCTICGKSHAGFTGHYGFKEKKMKYPKMPVDDQGRLLECPVCHNTELAPKGDFCPICGYAIVNICSEASVDYNSSCSNLAPLPSNHRYCPICGAPSTFLRRKILNLWDGSEFEEEDPELPF